MTRSEYEILLLDPRWLAYRERIFDDRGGECEACGITDRKALRTQGSSLQVHHMRYRGNPWDARPKDVQLLCRTCHMDIHDTRREAAAVRRTKRTWTDFWHQRDRPVLDPPFEELPF